MKNKTVMIGGGFAGRQACHALRGFQQKMIVVAHQAPRMNDRLIANTHLAKTADKQIDILLMFENITALIAPAHQMIPRTRILNS